MPLRALWVTALFALVNFVPSFSKLLGENDYMQGLFSLLFGALAGMCVLAWAKFKDVGGSEGNDKISNLNEVSAVTRQLATLLHSGIPLAQSLTAVIEQAEAPGLQKVLRHLREQVCRNRSRRRKHAELNLILPRNHPLNLTHASALAA